MARCGTWINSGGRLRDREREEREREDRERERAERARLRRPQAGATSGEAWHATARALNIDDNWRVDALNLEAKKLGKNVDGIVRSFLVSVSWTERGVPSVAALQRLRDNAWKAKAAEAREFQLTTVLRYLAAALENGSSGIRFGIECKLMHRKRLFEEGRPLIGGLCDKRNDPVDMFYHLHVWAQEEGDVNEVPSGGISSHQGLVVVNPRIEKPEGNLTIPYRLHGRGPLPEESVPIFKYGPICTTLEHAKEACSSLCEAIATHGLSVGLAYDNDWSPTGALFYLTVSLPDNQGSSNNGIRVVRRTS